MSRTAAAIDERPAPASQSPAEARERLGKMFGALGSIHKGERAAALHAIDKAMQAGGMSWADVAAAVAGPSGWLDMADASRNGTPVLLRIEIGLPRRPDLKDDDVPARRVRFVVGRWSVDGWTDGSFPISGYPTHCMPIPKLTEE
jgi:hypothetical protein